MQYDESLRLFTPQKYTLREYWWYTTLPLDTDTEKIIQ